MKTEEYLQNLIENIPKYRITQSDSRQIQKEGIKKYTYNKISSAKYRSSSMPQELAKTVEGKIDYAYENHLPIRIVFPFGAYKRWNFPTYPGIDYAEVFNMVLLREYLSQISEFYPYGVTLDYHSVELFVERNNHLPQKDLFFYQDEFRNFLEYFNNYMPKGLEFRFKNLREEISQKDCLDNIEKEMPKLHKEWPKISQKDKELKIKRAKISCKIDEKDPNYEEIIKDAVHVHDAFSNGCWNPDGKAIWNNGLNMIKIGNSYTEDWGIHIKSSKTSRVNFWVGTGVLLKRDALFLPTILSYQQHLSSRKDITYSKVGFLNNFSNLGEIGVLKT